MNRAFMSDSGFELRHEIQELKAEVRRLRRMIEGGCVVVGLAIAKIFPGHLQLLVIVGLVTIMYLALVYWRDEHNHAPQNRSLEG